MAGFCVSCTLYFSCEDTKAVDYGFGEYFEEIVTAVSENVFVLDNGKTLFNTNEKASKAYQSGDRILMNYTLLHETTAGYDYTVRINGSSKVPLTELSLVDQKTIQSLVSEPVFFESLWVGNHYLNLQFYINYKSETHSIKLLTDSSLIKNDTVYVYFKHDTKNDAPGYSSHVFLSADLEKTFGKSKRVLFFNINTINYGEKQYELKY
jgi:hypothetical protein